MKLYDLRFHAGKTAAAKLKENGFILQEAPSPEDMEFMKAHDIPLEEFSTDLGRSIYSKVLDAAGTRLYHPSIDVTDEKRRTDSALYRSLIILNPALSESPLERITKIIDDAFNEAIKSPDAGEPAAVRSTADSFTKSAGP